MSGNFDDVDRLAVEVSGLHKSYGSRKSAVVALDDLCMSVPKGVIYGLLGPSGCGKTTLLRCIIGRLTYNRGTVSTLGDTPGTPGHGIPGNRVGYMPQELALFNEFTISETLTYFSRLYRMPKQALKDRTQFLLELLHLPEETRLIRELSGGQQRRTSFAIALLQEPELLILDEPTVGVDPLLRQKIWEHLISIAKSGGTTIIITTHYVEEARQAHMVGLMRSGRLLAESPPLHLMQAHSLPTLEDVFLKLCQQDQVSDVEVAASPPSVNNARYDTDAPPTRRQVRRRGSGTRGSNDELSQLLSDEHHSTSYGSYQNDVMTAPVKPERKISYKAKCSYMMPSCLNILALMLKNFTILKRRIGFLLFEFLLPSIQIILFCTCVGVTPFNLNIAVVNNETIPQFGELFLREINNRTIVQHNFSQRGYDAFESVRKGENWGVISIGENFTTDLITRMSSSKPLDNSTIDGSTVHVNLDMTNQQIELTIQQEILSAFQRFVEDIEKEMHVPNPEKATIPIEIGEPIYGEKVPSFTNFMAPGIILSITFFMATGLTAMSFVLERKEGLMDRSFVAGVSAVEIMIGHILTQFTVMFVQVALLLVFALAVFKVPNEGSLALVLMLTLFQGLTGMALGVLISSICKEETSAIQASLGSVYPNMLLSGIIWPIESMPIWLRYISYALPMTFAADAMRSILARGWGLTYMPVWRGFLVSIGWGWLLLVVSAITLRMARD